MLDGFVELSADVGDCINISDLFNNLNLLAENSRGSSSKVFCNPVNHLFQIGAQNDEECVDIITGPSNSLSLSGVDRKLFLLQIRRSTQLNISDSANTTLLPSIQTKVDIKCGGNIIGSTGWRTSGSTLQFDVDCPRSDTVEVCMTYRLGPNATQFPASATGTVRVCGSVACIGGENRELTGFYNPGAIDPDCCYGREALCLANQNTRAICTAFANSGDQTVECFKVSSSDADNIILAGNLPSDAEFIVSGTMEVCYRATSSSRDGNLTIRPNIGCQGESFSCFNENRFVNRANQGDPYGPTQCAVIDIDICGSCQAGDSISAGLVTEALCNESPVPGTNTSFVEIVSVSQNYCVWLFNDVDTSSLPDLGNLALGRCLTDAAVGPLIEKVNRLCEFASQRTSINFDSFSLPSVDVDPGSYLIKPAEPWPPLNDPTNTDPAPVKKWRISIIAQACFESRGANNAEETKIAFATADLLCGADIILRGRRQWTFTASGGVFLCGQPMELTGCIECPIDEDLTLDLDLRMIVGFNAGAPEKFTYSVKAFCF